MPADLNARPTRTDVVNIYRLVLGRDPESAEVVEQWLGQAIGEWLPGFFKSSEFKDNVYSRMLRSEFLVGLHAAAAPGAALTRWAADFIPLSAEGQARVASAADWPALFHGLFEDERFVQTVLGDDAPRDLDAFLSALEDGSRTAQLSGIKGAVEVVGDREIRGWALDFRDPDRVLELELYVEGVFTAAGTAAVFRRDIQERFGGDGRVGFLIRYAPVPQQRRPLFGEVREAASGLVVGGFKLPTAQAPPLDELATIRRDLGELRGLLDRIESKLPAFNTAFGFPLDAYDAYFRTYYAPAEAAVAPMEDYVDLAVVIDASASSMRALDSAMAGVALQGRGPREVTVLFKGADLRIEIETLLARWRDRLGGAVAIAGAPIEDGDWAAAMNATVALARSSHLLFCRADAILAPEAIGAVFHALEAGAVLVYADEDEVEPTVGDREGRHVRPTFRTDFDYDLLLQRDWLGGLIGAPRDQVLAHGFRPEHAETHLYDLALRISAAGERANIVHIAKVLSHRSVEVGVSDRDASSDAQLKALQDHLSRTEPSALAELHQDILGADVPSAFRIRRTPKPGVKAAVIIPTRDRLDLLGPCIASLAASAMKNTVKTEILVVDNQSTAATTRAFFDSFSRFGDLRVIEHDGAFNWALINNRAAEQTDADVLIFLNNDTLVLSPDWCDELCANALRPDVGVVGARLLYEDGTIQHAGAITSEWNGFTAHEAMGAPGGDPGYLGRHALLREVSTLTGACMATRASLFRELGGFDALAFPVEGNDTDYCLRARARGYKVLYDPYATLYHFESKSRGYNTDDTKRASAELAGRILRERWGRRFEHDPFYNPHFDRLSPPFSRLRPPPPQPGFRRDG